MTSIPSILGIILSRTINSGSKEPTFSSPSTPSYAFSITCPWLTNVTSINLEMCFSSSTIRILAIPDTPVPQNLPKSILGATKNATAENRDLVSDSCFIEIGFTATGVAARAFLSTGV